MTALYRLPSGTCLLHHEGAWLETAPGHGFDSLFQSLDAAEWLAAALATARPASPPDPETAPLAAPLESQEVWAAGVTYYRSRVARMEEAEVAGGAIFYDKVYDADRPELFFKATPFRARGHRAGVRVREDSAWDVPEPELTLAINTCGQVFGCTIGNDMSSRSIEGENPLYLPQAKVYRGSCAMGPALIIGNPPGPEAAIRMEIRRDGATVFTGETSVSQIKRGFDELAGWLFKENEFPHGAYLMTGAGIVPDSDFTLRSGDEVRITIEGLGELVNVVE